MSLDNVIKKYWEHDEKKYDMFSLSEKGRALENEGYHVIAQTAVRIETTKYCVTCSKPETTNAKKEIRRCILCGLVTASPLGQCPAWADL